MGHQFHSLSSVRLGQTSLHEIMVRPGADVTRLEPVGSPLSRGSKQRICWNALGLLVPMAVSMLSALAGLFLAQVFDGGGEPATDREYPTIGEVIGGAFAATLASVALCGMPFQTSLGGRGSSSSSASLCRSFLTTSRERSCGQSCDTCIARPGSQLDWHFTSAIVDATAAAIIAAGMAAARHPGKLFAPRGKRACQPMREAFAAKRPRLEASIQDCSRLKPELLKLECRLRFDERALHCALSN